MTSRGLILREPLLRTDRPSRPVGGRALDGVRRLEAWKLVGTQQRSSGHA